MEGNGQGGNVQVEEEKLGSLQGMQDDDGSIIDLPPHREISRESHVIDPGDGHRCRGSGDVCGVITTHDDISGVPGGCVTGKGTQLGKSQRKIHLQTLEE